MTPASPASARLGMALCALAMAIFAVQDAVSKVLVKTIPAAQFMMVRYWVFTIGIMLLAAWKGRLASSLRPNRPGLQIIRGSLSAFEIVLFAFGLKFLGLAEAHALFATFPLMAAAMAVIVLGERLSLARAGAIAAGFLGALLIIKPGLGVFRPAAFIALGAAALFAGYQVTTRMAARHDDYITSLVHMALVGAVVLTPLGLWVWKAPDATQWIMIAFICTAGIAAHLLLVKALEYTQASALQPFNYFLLAFAALIGVGWFGERPDVLSITGALVIAASGLFAVIATRR